MNIAMIVHAYYLKDARVRRYAELLAHRGHRVDVLCLREMGEPLCEEHSGVRVYRMNISRRRGGMLSYIVEYCSAFIRAFWKLNMLCAKGNRYDLVHVHNFPNCLVFACVIQKCMGTKVILDVHDPMPELFCSKFKIGRHHPIIRFLLLEERVCTRFADYVIAANHFFRDVLVDRGCPLHKIGVIMNSPDHHFFDDGSRNPRANEDGRPFNIIYVGTLAERYGLETALRAIARIRRDGAIPRLKLTIIPKIKNEGRYLEWTLNEVESLGLKDTLCLLDPVPHDRMPRIVRNADLLVYSPLSDVHMDIALSLKIPEAIAVGRPVVASRLSVLKRYFGEDALFMFEPGNVDDCAAKILQVYRCPEETRLRVRKAQEMLREFCWDREQKKYLKEIDMLVRCSPRMA